jgi:V/A-type H+/Na+-transporting ATPase subunit E
MANDTKQSSGVQELIDRLHQEGVAQGQNEAESLVTDARRQSMTILDNARKEAEEILAKARAEARRIVEDGNEALRLASRDVMLRLREAFHSEFERRVQKLVAFTLEDRRFLEQLILEVARRASPEDPQKRLKVLLPEGEVSEEQLAAEVADVPEGSLAHFVLGLAADVLREGLTFGVSDDPSPGVRVQIVEDDVQLELTDETITALLLQYLAPRFRAVLEKGA